MTSDATCETCGTPLDMTEERPTAADGKFYCGEACAPASGPDREQLLAACTSAAQAAVNLLTRAETAEAELRRAREALAQIEAHVSGTHADDLRADEIDGRIIALCRRGLGDERP